MKVGRNNGYEVGRKKGNIGIKGNMHTVGISVLGNDKDKNEKKEIEYRLRDVGRRERGEIEYSLKENNFTVGILVLEI